MRATLPAVAKKREGRADHLVPGSDLQGHHGEEQGVRARGDKEPFPESRECGHFGFKDFGFRPQQELPGLKHRHHRRREFLPQRSVLGIDVKERNLSWSGRIEPGGTTLIIEFDWQGWVVPLKQDAHATCHNFRPIPLAGTARLGNAHYFAYGV